MNCCSFDVVVRDNCVKRETILVAAAEAATPAWRKGGMLQ